MKHIDFYFDFISPYAYLAFEKLPLALQGVSHSVRYKPVLFAGMLAQHGQLGPAEIAPKREWTYRQVLWLAHEHGVRLDMPAAHPFNPLPLLRLALAHRDDLPNRYACEQIFRHVWQGGKDAADPQRLEALTQHLKPQRDPANAEVKAQLKAITDEALSLGLFGVPSFVVDGKVFWGLDALPMLRAYCVGDPWFTPGGAWEAAGAVGIGQTRRP
jgi:2-hydroxychromene-2-carboxylate isomerase